MGGRLQFLGRRTVRLTNDREPLRLHFDVPTGQVTLMCTQNQRPFPFRMLRLVQTDDNELVTARYEVLTDAHGHATIDALPTGRWRAAPMHGGRCQPDEFVVTGGAALAPQLQIVPR
jgi:hypothetical protein